MNAPKGNAVIAKNSTYPKSRYAKNLKMLIIVRRERIRINVKKENRIGVVINIKNRLTSNKKDDK
jgi:hypothetical protein